MPIVVDMRRSIFFQEAKTEGMRQVRKTNKAFVLYLLQHTDHSAEHIAQLVDVPLSFVNKIKNTLKK